MTLRTPVSIFLLSALLAGIVGPYRVCALMCERHSQAESHRHCSHPADPMAGMMHHRSAMMHHPDTDAVTPLSVSQTCQVNCDVLERLNLSTKAVEQRRVSQTQIAVPDPAATVPVLDVGIAWRSDAAPPAGPTARREPFDVLRI